MPETKLLDDADAIVLVRGVTESFGSGDAQLLTTHPERFLIAERIRERMLQAVREELPFTAALLVERESHRSILIGRGGQAIKAIGIAARLDLEQFLGRKVHLDLRVRYEPDWREDPRILTELDRDLVASFEPEIAEPEE